MNESLTNPRLAFCTTIACVVVVSGCGPPSVVESTELPTAVSPEPATTPTVSTTVDSTETAAENAVLTSDAAETELAADVETSAENSAAPPENVSDPTVATEDSAKLPSMKVRPRSRLRKGGILDLTFDDVEFDIERDADFERSMLTEEIESLHGKEVIIRGFILESYQLKNIKEFVLVRDNQECCFGPGAYIFHNMQVEMVGDARAEYSLRPVTVRGKFSIKPWIGPDGKCYSVYHVAATSFHK